MASIYHITTASEVERAGRTGQYLPAEFGADGYIHCSYAHQLRDIANSKYRGRRDLVLVEIDPTKLTCPIVEENAAGKGQGYPHILGALSMSSVVSIRELPCLESGSIELPCNVGA